MHLDALFRLGSNSALVGWVLLIFLPHWRGIAKSVSGLLVPVLLSVAYAGLILTWWSRAGGGFGSLDDLAKAFTTRGVLLAGWLHYLAFDMLIGAWEVREAKRIGMPHWSIVPALVLTFLFGPAGYLLFIGQRWAFRLAQHAKPVSDAPAPAELSLSRMIATAQPALLAAGLVMLSALLPTFVAHLLDDRLLAGDPIWLKPMRFELSLGVYLLTLAVFFPMAGSRFGNTLLGRFVVWGAITPAFLEAGYIVFQAARGMASHYNTSTPTYQTLYSLMGVTAVILTLAAPALGLGIARGYRSKPAGMGVFTLSVVIGLFLTFGLGGIEGMFMAAGPNHFGRIVASGAEIPVFGWSLTTGDLRIAHFFGIHAQQAIPLCGLILSRATSPSRGRLLLIIFSILYAALVLATFLQARAGIPLIAL